MQTTPSPQVAQGAPVTVPGSPSANAVYEGFIHQRDELRNQLSRLNDQRSDLSGQLQEHASGPSNAADTRGLEQRIAQVDARIAEVEKAIATSDAQVAASAAVPGAIIEQPPYERPGPPDEVYVLTGLFFVVVLFPISFAFARRIWKRASNAVTTLPQELFDRFTRVEQNLDAIAIEVERLGEGQRYVSRVLTERSMLGAGSAEPVEQPKRERQAERR
jgi:hypothetical protein